MKDIGNEKKSAASERGGCRIRISGVWTIYRLKILAMLCFIFSGCGIIAALIFRIDRGAASGWALIFAVAAAAVGALLQYLAVCRK